MRSFYEKLAIDLFKKLVVVSATIVFVVVSLLVYGFFVPEPSQYVVMSLTVISVLAGMGLLILLKRE